MISLGEHQRLSTFLGLLGLGPDQIDRPFLLPVGLNWQLGFFDKYAHVSFGQEIVEVGAGSGQE